MGRRVKNIPQRQEQTADRPCNHGDVRICQVCQYNDDCPYTREDDGVTATRQKT